MSVHLLAQCRAKWRPKGCRKFQHPAGIEPMPPNSMLLTLTTKPKVSIKWPGKTVDHSLNFTTRNCVLNWRSLIVQIEYQGQTRNTRILERKPLIDTSYRVLSHAGWTVTQEVIVYKGRLLKKASNRKLKLVLSRLPCLGWSLHGLQTR